jgi:exopolysaccharide biosynthesis WecB/TagA/CpsF family protein
VVEALKTNLLQKFPKLQIAGTISPPFRLLTADEQADFLNQISTSGAGVLFVGMGCPKQEDWAYQHAKQLDMAVLCVGAAFDFHAGTVKRAPLWMQKNGLEWAFRLSQEPGRLFKRYAWYNSIFAICILAQWLRLWKPKAL